MDCIFLLYPVEFMPASDVVEYGRRCGWVGEWEVQVSVRLHTAVWEGKTWEEDDGGGNRGWVETWFGDFSWEPKVVIDV
jgi:hypothetical protein